MNSKDSQLQERSCFKSCPDSVGQFVAASEFYNRIYKSRGYADFDSPETHFAFRELSRFIETFDLRRKKCLEVGCGRGLFQDLVDDYTGVDLSDSVAALLHKPFVACDAGSRLPFADSVFDAIWSITVLEHIANPDVALSEMRRVLKPGGLLFLKPAWHCRSWICEGIPVRRYRDLTFRQGWIKATLPIRDSLVVRAAATFPKRVVHWTLAAVRKQPISLNYGQLPVNYDKFWMVDSDAVVSLDPFDVILWFRDRNDDVVSHPSLRSAFFSRSEPVVVRIDCNG